MIRRFCRLIAALLTVMLLAGCGTSFYDPKSTMRSPRPTGDMENLLKALESAAGKDIVLKYPDSAGTRSAFLLHDLDGDGVEEALAFYQKRAEGALTRVNLIRNVSGVWRSVQDLDPIGSELLSVDFGDLNGDGIDEVITGWSVYNTKENQMCVYQQRNGRLVQRANEAYTQYVVCDIDNCGSDEVAIIQLNTTAKTAMMNFLRFENDQMTVKGTVQLDGNVTGYMKVKCAPLNNSNMGIFIDAYKGAQGLITELVTYENSMMVNKFFDIQKQETTQTMRYLMMASSDINRDGYIEIPFATELPGYPSSAPEKKEYLITWQSYDGQGRFPLAFRAWYCPDY